jgi:error-prone DNA polymerase
MTTEERLIADYADTGLTVGKHPMAYRREELRREHILSADELKDYPHGRFVRAAGCVIARQRLAQHMASSSSQWRMKPGLPT